MSKLNGIQKLEVIAELSKGTSGGKLAKQYGINKSSIKYIKDKNITAIQQNATDIIKIKEEIFVLALNQLKTLVLNTKQQPLILIKILTELNTQLRLDYDKPTSITKRDDYSKLTSDEIEDKVKHLYIEYKSLQVKNASSVNKPLDPPSGTI